MLCLYLLSLYILLNCYSIYVDKSEVLSTFDSLQSVSAQSEMGIMNTITRTIIIALYAISVVRNTDSQCLSSCPDNGCPHIEALGWVLQEHDITF